VTSAADAVIGLYQRHGLAWAGDRGDRLVEGGWLDRFRGLMPAGGSVLDIGCGSGRPMARYLIEQGFTVTGIDSAPCMIGLCGSNFPQQDWRVGDMRTLDLGRTFDGLLAWDSFFHLSQDAQRRMFPIFRAHAGPQAAPMFTSGKSDGEAIGSFRGEALYHASLDGAEYRALLDASGFAVVGHLVEDPACGNRTVWLAQRR
jgi:SAM-dependent methyltransferase